MLRRTTLALFAGTLFAMSATAQTSTAFVNTLMPEPAHLSAQAGTLPLTTSFTAATGGFHDQRLDDAISRMLTQLESKTGLQIATTPASSGTATLTISVDGAGEAIQSVDENESYIFDITAATGTSSQSRNGRGRNARPADFSSAHSERWRKLLSPRRLHSGHAPLPLARPDDRLQPPLQARRRSSSARSTEWPP